MYAGHFAAGLAIKAKVPTAPTWVDWSHSLTMSAVWAGLYFLCFVRYGRTVMTAMAIAVFSHFFLDLPMHPGDLALWPGSSVHLGMGLWRTLPTGWWFVELAVIGVGVGYYWRRSQVVKSFGARAWAVAATVLTLHIANSPWLSAP